MTQRDIAERHEEKRQKVRQNLMLINREYESKSIEAIGQCHKEVEDKVEREMKQ